MSNVIHLKPRPVKGQAPALIGQPQHYCMHCQSSVFHLVMTGDVLCGNCNRWISNLRVWETNA